MKYFVGYLIEGKAAEWYFNVAKDISEKFNTWKLHEKLPAHVTVFYPFETEDVEPVRNLVENWTHNKNIPGNLTIAEFDHFDDRVVFAKTDPDESVRDAVEELRGILEKIPGMLKDNFPIWHPHNTLANHLTPEEIKQIWNYVQTLEKPDFIIPFDNITIFRFEGDRKWVVQESFKFKP